MADFGFTVEDDRIKRACEYVFSTQLESGAFGWSPPTKPADCHTAILIDALAGCLDVLTYIPKDVLYEQLIPTINAKYVLRELLSLKGILDEATDDKDGIPFQKSEHSIESFTNLNDLSFADLRFDQLTKRFTVKSIDIQKEGRTEETSQTTLESYVGDRPDSMDEPLSKLEEVGISRMTELPFNSSIIATIIRRFGIRSWDGSVKPDETRLNRRATDLLKQYNINPRDIEGFGSGHWVMMPKKKPFFYGVPLPHSKRGVNLAKYDDWFENWPEIHYPRDKGYVC